MKGCQEMSKGLVLYEESYGVTIPNTTDVKTLVACNKSLPGRDIKKIITAVDNELYDMAAEYIWSRTINTLKQNIMKFGEEFVAEMLDRPDTSVGDIISEFEIISLSADLGFINKTAKMEFLQFSETIQHFMSNDDPEEEFPVTKLSDIVRSCIKHVLGFAKVEYEMSFVSFRDRLKTEYINSKHDIYQQLIIAPYFFKRTVCKTLLNLAKTTSDSAEREIVLSNMVQIITAIWDEISSEDKWSIGRSYAQANNDGDSNLVKSLKSVLLKTKGFDYVPENLRSNSYIKAAKNLLSAHFGWNNFHNEPTFAKSLDQMGTSIPAPALGVCLTSVLACKLGNIYGVSLDAQKYLDNIIGKISIDRWEYYFDKVLIKDEVILYKIIQDSKIRNRWIDLINSLDLSRLNITNSKIRELLECNTATKNSHLKVIVSKLYSEIR